MKSMRATARKRGQRGVVAVEFALTIPLVVLIFFTGTYLGAAQVRQARMQDAAQSIARVCAARSVALNGLSQCIVDEISRFEGIQSNCGGNDQWITESAIEPEDFDPLEADRSVRFIVLEVGCPYSWDFGCVGVPELNLQVQAAMPLNF